MKRRVHGIFCLEGDWWNDFNRSSTVKPILKLLREGVGLNVPYVHRDVATRAEFEHYCQRWTQAQMHNHPILYLAFHGEAGVLFVGDRRKKESVVTLDELASVFGEQLTGRMIHFGSCATVATDRRNIQRFLRNTGALAVTGFRQSVDWLHSAVFDALLFEALLREPMTSRGLMRVHRRMKDEHPAMCRALDFRMEIRDKPRR